MVNMSQGWKNKLNCWKNKLNYPLFMQKYKFWLPRFPVCRNRDNRYPHVVKLSGMLNYIWVLLTFPRSRSCLRFFCSSQLRPFAADCICEIPCISTRWVLSLNTDHELSNMQYWEEKISAEPGFKPRAAWWEARMLPLCYAPPSYLRWVPRAW